MPKRRTSTTFVPGHPKYAGRRPGHKNRIPGTVKASVKRALEELAKEEPEMIKAAIRRGINAAPPKSYPYIQLAAAYLDGKPVERVEVESTERQRFVVVLRSEADPLALPELGAPVMLDPGRVPSE